MALCRASKSIATISRFIYGDNVKYYRSSIDNCLTRASYACKFECGGTVSFSLSVNDGIPHADVPYSIGVGTCEEVGHMFPRPQPTSTRLCRDCAVDGITLRVFRKVSE